MAGMQQCRIILLRQFAAAPAFRRLDALRNQYDLRYGGQRQALGRQSQRGGSRSVSRTEPERATSTENDHLLSDVARPAGAHLHKLRSRGRDRDAWYEPVSFRRRENGAAVGSFTVHRTAALAASCVSSSATEESCASRARAAATGAGTPARLQAIAAAASRGRTPERGLSRPFAPRGASMSKLIKDPPFIPY
jgi:hypothetical protein